MENLVLGEEDGEAWTIFCALFDRWLRVPCVVVMGIGWGTEMGCNDGGDDSSTMSEWSSTLSMEELFPWTGTLGINCLFCRCCMKMSQEKRVKKNQGNQHLQNFEMFGLLETASNHLRFRLPVTTRIKHEKFNSITITNK